LRVEFSGENSSFSLNKSFFPFDKIWTPFKKIETFLYFVPFNKFPFFLKIKISSSFDIVQNKKENFRKFYWICLKEILLKFCPNIQKPFQSDVVK